MATMAEIRTQYPQYADIPDVKLADALHQKFYSDIPKPEFYQKIGLGAQAQIPGAEGVITAQPAPMTLQDRLMGAVETPAIIAGGLGRMVATPLARMYGEAMGGQGTPQGKAAGEQAATWASNQFYQPRTQTGPELVEGAGKVLESLPPVLSGPGAAITALTPAAINQLRPMAQRIAAPVQNVLAKAMTKAEPEMVGMGAAETQAALLRQERAQRQGIPLTKGEQTKDLATQQFEAETAKNYPAGAGAPLLKAKETQKSAILNKFEQMSQETGAEYADPSAYKKVGSIVDKALVDEYDKKYQAMKAKYAVADNAGETLQEVPYTAITEYIGKQSPTVRAKLAPILDSVAEQIALNDPQKKGTMSVRALEDIYQDIGKNTQPGTPNAVHSKAMKSLIDQTTEGAGGDFYRDARMARKQLAKDFEDSSRVASLLGTKAGYADRKVALADVFDHIVLDGSMEEMQTVGKVLKRAGPQGQQAWAEIQGQTIQHLKDQITKNASGQLSFPKLNTAINALDREDKLTYLFGKTGRDQLIDLRDSIQDALVKQPGAVNYSNTSSALIRSLDQLSKFQIPLAGKLADVAKTKAMEKQVAESLNFNALTPKGKSTNALAP